MPEPTRRAGDDDRLRTAEQLREHYAAGRLDSAELDDRLEAVYRARTMNELAALTADLPSDDPYQLPVPATFRPLNPPSRPHAAVLRAQWVSYLAVVSALLVGWVVSGLPDESYPAWVMLAWGAAIAAQSIRRPGR